MACALVSPCGKVELLHDANISVGDVLAEPVHSMSIRGLTLFFSSAAFFSSEVNEFASGLAQQLIKGDVCLIHEQQQQLLQCLSQSKQLRMAQAACPSASNCNSACGQAVVVSEVELVDPPPTSCNSCQSSYLSSTCAESSGCLLKRPRSLQHIAAANSTRQRILRSMSAAAAAATSADGSSLHTSWHGAPPAAVTYSSDSAITTASLNNSRLPPSNSRRMSAAADGPCCNSQGHARDCSSSSIPSFHSFSGRGMQSAIVHPLIRPSGVLQQQCSSGNTNHAGVDFAGVFQQEEVVGNSSTTGRPVLAAVLQQCNPGSRPVTQLAVEPRLHQMFVRHPAQQQQLQQQQPGVPCAALPVPLWGDLPVEVVAQVARCVGGTVAAVMPICMTCRSWRQAVLEDDQLLLGLSFTLNAPPPRCSHSSNTTHRGLVGKAQHPVLLERAAKLGNVSALVVRARLFDAAGLPDEAMRCWRKAAKAGHLEAQLLYGLALYRGTAGVAPDPEDAHLWLSKALKQVLAAKAPGSASSQGASAGSSSSSSTPPEVSSRPPTALLHTNCLAAAAAASSHEAVGLACRVLTQAGLVLGYLAFDGEATRTDKQEAVRCFKLAAQAGCKEAQQVLGWIFNTGQY